jgi:hypothetical protein
MNRENDMPKLPAALGPAPWVARESLARTQQLIAARHTSSAWALAFTIFVLVAAPGRVDSFVAEVRSLGLPFAGVLLAGALVCWAWHLRVCWRLKSTGLGPSPGLRPRAMWSLGGFLVGLAVDEFLRASLQVSWPGILPGACAMAALFVGERLRQVVTADEIKVITVQTLLDADRDLDQPSG